MVEDEENIITKRIKYWEERIGIKLGEGSSGTINEIAYGYLDETIECLVANEKEARRCLRRFKAIGQVKK